MIKQAELTIDGVPESQLADELERSTTKSRADAQRDYILGTARAEGMALGGAAGGAAGGLGGYYGGRALSRKLGLDDKSWKSKALRYGLGTLGTVGGAYLGGKLGHSGASALQNKLMKHYGYGVNDEAVNNAAWKIADVGNQLYKKYNI